MASFGEVLATFKKNESPENIYPLTSDTHLCNALVAWKSVSIQYKEQADCAFLSEQEMWSWLWSRVEFDIALFGVVAGCKAQEASTLVHRLIGLRLIYPDATINNYAKQYLGQKIIASISGRKKKKEET